MFIKRKESTKPSIGRISHLAFLVLEQAAVEAIGGPIQRTPAHRLALAWMAFTDIASPFEAEHFWDYLAHAKQYAGDDGAFYRQCDPRMLLTTWKQRAGKTPRS